MNQSIFEQLDQLYKSVDEVFRNLKEEKAKEEESKEESWPKVGDGYLTKIDGTVGCYTWNADNIDQLNMKTGNCFRTREEAEMSLLRDQAGAKRWFPGWDQKYYYWSFIDGEVSVTAFTASWDVAMYFVGNCHRTVEEAEAWGKNCGEAFELPKL